MVWQKAPSGNRNCEPRRLVDEHSEALLNAAIEKALAGNSSLLKAFLGHLIAPAKWRAINTRQRRILIAVAVTLAGMLLYPPLRILGIPNIVGSRNPGVTYGYDWLLSNVWGSVEIGLLFTQFFVVGVIAVIAYVLCANK